MKPLRASTSEIPIGRPRTASESGKHTGSRSMFRRMMYDDNDAKHVKKLNADPADDLHDMKSPPTAGETERKNRAEKADASTENSENETTLTKDVPPRSTNREIKRLKSKKSKIFNQVEDLNIISESLEEDVSKKSKESRPEDSGCSSSSPASISDSKHPHLFLQKTASKRRMENKAELFEHDQSPPMVNIFPNCLTLQFPLLVVRPNLLLVDKPLKSRKLLFVADSKPKSMSMRRE